MANWITNPNEIHEALLSLSTGETFVLRVSSTAGYTHEHAKVTKSIGRDRRNGRRTIHGNDERDILVETELASEPTNQRYPVTISYSPSQNIFVKEDPSQREIIAVCRNPLEVTDYHPNAQKLYAVCNQCGQKARIPLSESEGPFTGPTVEKNAKGEQIVPCCHSPDWSTVMEDKN